MLWEASSIEVWFSFWYSSKKFLTKSPVSGSRDAVGSSRSKTVGSLIIDLAKLTIIPNGLSRGQRAKFLRENENTISQDEYDRILKKQTDLQLAKGN